MDLSVLKRENLPEQVIEFIDEKLNYISSGEMVLLKHNVRPYISNPLVVDNRVYMQYVASEGMPTFLCVVNWVNSRGRIHSLDYNEMYLHDLKIFNELMPILLHPSL